MFPIETTTKLLKLHFQWPDRKRYNAKEDQALEYFKWLFLNHHDRPEVMLLEDVQQVEEFLATHMNVLWPTRKEEEKWANLRLEPRIENDVSIELTIVQSDDLAAIGESVTGRTLDIGLHGLRVTVTDEVATGSILKLLVYQNDDREHAYRLNAELRWSTPMDDGFLIGIKLIEDSDFSNWQADFGKVFVAPAMSRRKTSQRKPD